MSMKHILATIMLMALTGGAVMMVNRYYSPHTTKTITPKSCELKTNMRVLWAEHVLWMREYIVSAIAGAADTKDVTDRLLQNQVDIGNALVPFYGDETGKKLTDLLKDHIQIAGDVVAAAKTHNPDKLNDANERWRRNAVEIATFLSKLNDKWPLQDLIKMLNEHLKLTADDAVARVEKEWKTDIKTFDEIFKQAMMMADHLTFGIIDQFPKKF